MACSGAYADHKDFGDYFCFEVEAEDAAVVDKFLKLAASRIHAARHASAQCDCSLAEWTNDYLKELNILIALVTYSCPCSGLQGKFTAEEKSAILTAVQADLVAIRESKIELCAGETGADFPWTGWAEQGVTEFARAQIIANSVLRNS